MAEALGVEPGEKVKLSLQHRSLVVEVIGDPLKLALRGKKSVTINPDEIEAVSLAEQSKHLASSS